MWSQEKELATVASRHHQLIRLVEKEVGRFQVAMHYAAFMKISNSEAYLLKRIHSIGQVHLPCFPEQIVEALLIPLHHNTPKAILGGGPQELAHPTALQGRVG